MKKLLILTAIALGVAGCETKETMKTKLTENLDTTYKAGEDFFTLVNEYGEDPALLGNKDGHYATIGQKIPE